VSEPEASGGLPAPGAARGESRASGPRTVLLLSGPNLNLLGTRQPAIYGAGTLDDHAGRARGAAAERGWQLDHVQSNHEGVLVDAIHAARATTGGIVINAGAFTHYAWALHDALAAYDPPVVELHLSNPVSREPWRHLSVIAPVATAVIAGLGGRGYPLAVTALIDLVEDRT
jgi:3-dehydroquinate dehydratase-2